MPGINKSEMKHFKNREKIGWAIALIGWSMVYGWLVTTPPTEWEIERARPLEYYLTQDDVPCIRTLRAAYALELRRGSAEGLPKIVVGEGSNDLDGEFAHRMDECGFARVK